MTMLGQYFIDILDEYKPSAREQKPGVRELLMDAADELDKIVSPAYGARTYAAGHGDTKGLYPEDMWVSSWGDPPGITENGIQLANSNLFRADGKGVEITIMTHTNTWRSRYKGASRPWYDYFASPRNATRQRIDELGLLSGRGFYMDNNYRLTHKTTVDGHHYPQGTVVHKPYTRTQLENESSLVDDIQLLVKVFTLITDPENVQRFPPR